MKPSKRVKIQSTKVASSHAITPDTKSSSAKQQRVSTWPPVGDDLANRVDFTISQLTLVEYRPLDFTFLHVDLPNSIGSHTVSAQIFENQGSEFYRCIWISECLTTQFKGHHAIFFFNFIVI